VSGFPEDSERQHDAWEEIRFLLEAPYVVLDTETTGLLSPELVSIAIVDDRGRPLMHEFVHPAKPIEPEASRVTGLTMEAVAGNAEFPAIAPRVSEALAGMRVAIYNAAYDTQVLRNTYARYGLTVPDFTPWCAMEWFARLNGEWDERRGTYAWQPLAKAAAFFGLSAENAHDALGDSLTTWRILQEAFRRAGLRVGGMDSLF
jgi:DNA polymerase-3 subunit epsilon